MGRWMRGMGCSLSFCCPPLGALLSGDWIARTDSSRLEQGLTLILTGIEGQSSLNISILLGLVDAGVPTALKICDWTTGNKLLSLYHLRAINRNRRVAKELAQSILDYQQRFPDRPVHLIGHSGGGAMALLILESLPENAAVSSVIMLNSAISPGYSLLPARKKVKSAIWNVSSWLDYIFLGAGTFLCGTVDGVHTLSAGMTGFSNDVTKPHPEYCPVIEVPWRWNMCQSFHFGGHFSVANRVFIAEQIAPLLTNASPQSIVYNSLETEMHLVQQ